MARCLLLAWIACYLAASIQSAEPISSPAVLPASTPWTVERVARAAADHSPKARLLQAELSALSASADRKQDQACSQLALAQRVLREWICYEREQSAAQAKIRAIQWGYLQQQRLQLVEAQEIVQVLLRLTDKANELELKDGDRQLLELRQLELSGRQAEAEGASEKLLIAIIELTGEPELSLLPPVLGQPTDEGSDRSLAEWLTQADSQRCDLRAIEQLCQSLNGDTLPMVRQALAMVQPGLGLAIAIAAKKPLIAALHEQDRAPAELRQRREQCTSLLQARRGQVKAEVQLAFAGVRSLTTRVALAEQAVQIRTQMVRQTGKAIELDQARPGADLLSNLELIESQAALVELQSKLAVAKVNRELAAGAVIGNLE